MPYVKPETREQLESRPPATTGELNYAITKVLDNYVETKGLSYDAINDVLGALEGARAEFYRRIAVPYENAKWARNGDVYQCARQLESENR